MTYMDTENAACVWIALKIGGSFKNNFELQSLNSNKLKRYLER